MSALTHRSPGDADEHVSADFGRTELVIGASRAKIARKLMVRSVYPCGLQNWPKKVKHDQQDRKFLSKNFAEIFFSTSKNEMSGIV